MARKLNSKGKKQDSKSSWKVTQQKQEIVFCKNMLLFPFYSVGFVYDSHRVVVESINVAWLLFSSLNSLNQVSARRALS